MQEEEADRSLNSVVQQEPDYGIGELVDDESELAEADDEDNISLDYQDTDDSVSLTGPHEDEEQEF